MIVLVGFHPLRVLAEPFTRMGTERYQVRTRRHLSRMRVFEQESPYGGFLESLDLSASYMALEAALAGCGGYSLVGVHGWERLSAFIRHYSEDGIPDGRYGPEPSCEKSWGASQMLTTAIPSRRSFASGARASSIKPEVFSSAASSWYCSRSTTNARRPGCVITILTIWGFSAWGYYRVTLASGGNLPGLSLGLGWNSPVLICSLCFAAGRKPRFGVGLQVGLGGSGALSPRALRGG